jgi:hypothetical protein
MTARPRNERGMPPDRLGIGSFDGNGFGIFFLNADSSIDGHTTGIQSASAVPGPVVNQTNKKTARRRSL